MNLRWFCIALLMLLPELALAEVNCVVVARIISVQTAMVNLRNNPLRIVSADNRKLLRGELSSLTDATLAREVYAEASRESRIAIEALLTQARSVANRPEGALYQPLQTKGWGDILTRADNALGQFPCLVTEARHSGDGSGRNAVSDDSGPDASDEGFAFKVEDLPEKAAYSLGTLAMVAGAVALILPWLRRRQQLQKRRARRFNVALGSAVVAGDQKCDAQIVNLSCNGAKVRYWAQEPFADRSRIAVTIEDDPRECTVMWSNNLFLGVKFDKSLRISHVRRLAQVSRFDALGRKIRKT